MNITGGKLNGRKIITPDTDISRPTLSKTRMGVFNTLYSLLGDFSDKSFLDLFGGSGIMGLEALSRGFNEVKVCEINKKSAEVIRKNYELLGYRADITVCDGLSFIKKNDRSYDVIYIDPPYKSGIYDEVLSLLKNGIAIVESDFSLTFERYNIIKQKKYSSSLITYIKL